MNVGIMRKCKNSKINSRETKISDIKVQVLRKKKVKIQWKTVKTEGLKDWILTQLKSECQNFEKNSQNSLIIGQNSDIKVRTLRLKYNLLRNCQKKVKKRNSRKKNLKCKIKVKIVS